MPESDPRWDQYGTHAFLVLEDTRRFKSRVTLRVGLAEPSICSRVGWSSSAPCEQRTDGSQDQDPCAEEEHRLRASAARKVGGCGTTTGGSDHISAGNHRGYALTFFCSSMQRYVALLVGIEEAR